MQHTNSPWPFVHEENISCKFSDKLNRIYIDRIIEMSAFSCITHQFRSKTFVILVLSRCSKKIPIYMYIGASLKTKKVTLKLTISLTFCDYFFIISIILDLLFVCPFIRANFHQFYKFYIRYSRIGS